MNRLKLFFAFLSFASLMVSAPVLAKVDIGLDGATGTANQIAAQSGYDTANVDDTTLSKQVGKIIKVALSFVGTLFFVLTVYAGFLWMTASGNEEQVAKAQSIIKMAVIGMVITLAAYGITTYVLLTIVASTRTATCIGTSC